MLIYHSVLHYTVGYYLLQHSLPPEHLVTLVMKLKPEQVTKAFAQMRKKGIVTESDELDVLKFSNRFIAQISSLRVGSPVSAVMTLQSRFNAVLSQPDAGNTVPNSVRLRRFVRQYGFEHVERVISEFRQDKRKVNEREFENRIRGKYSNPMNIEEGTYDY